MQSMDDGRIQVKSGYAALTHQLAARALATAEDAAPHRARQGERRWPMANALPAARGLIALDDDLESISSEANELLAVVSDPTGRVTDGFGHTRPIYTWLAMHLLGSAAKRIGDAEALVCIKCAAQAWLAHAPARDAADPRLAVWRRLIAQQHGIIGQAEDLPLATDQPAPLVPLDHDALIDAWTYRELVGLHGLHLCALFEPEAGHAIRAEQAALYHLDHTQPDYTTYQPWGLAAFASHPPTSVFAEQQLHDAATHLSIAGPGGAVLPALLLADAAARLSGVLGDVWPGV